MKTSVNPACSFEGGNLKHYASYARAYLDPETREPLDDSTQ